MAEDCKDTLQQQGMSAKGAQQLLDEVFAAGANSNERVRFAQGRAAEAERLAKMRDFQGKLKVIALADARAHVDAFTTRGESTWEGLRSFLLGSDKPVPNAQLSVDNGIHERIQAIDGGLQRDLRALDGNLFGWIQDPGFSYEVGKAKWMLGEEDGGARYRPPETAWGHLVQPTARVFDKYAEQVRQALNNLGADIRKETHHVMPQYHDPARLLKAGKENWVNTILPLLDQERTFALKDGPQLTLRDGRDPRAVLGDIFDKIVDDSWSGWGENRLSGRGGNLATSLSQSRQLHFKDYDSFFKYNDQFGASNVIEGMTRHLLRQARNWGIMERMGPNPEAFAEQLIRGYGKAAAPPGAYSIKPSAEIMAQTLLGKDNVPGSAAWANFMRGARRLQDMAHLGSSLASQLPDIATISARASFNGAHYLDDVSSMLTAFFKGHAKGEMLDAAQDMGVFTDGILGHVNQRFGAFDSADGAFSKAVEKFYTLSGMNRWDDSQREGFAFMRNAQLARAVQRGTAFGDLDPLLRTNLERYGIGNVEWGQIGAPNLVKLETGQTFLRLETLPEGAQRGLRNFFISESDKALPLPGTYERAWMYRGSRPGTFVGEMARMFWRYKGVSVTMGTRVLPQVWRTGKIGALAAFLAEALPLGYASYALREGMQGRLPPDPSKPQTVIQSLARSGGLGYAGDLFLSLGEDMNKTAMDVIAGPTGATVNNVFHIGQMLMHGKPDIGARTFRLLMSETPMVNLWYAKLALNYLFSWRVQEYLNPGYLQRMEHHFRQNDSAPLMQQTGQGPWIVPPSEVIPRGGF